MEVLKTLITLMVAHAFTDFVFQTEFMANMKNWDFHHKSKYMVSEPNKYFSLWMCMLGIHCVINGAGVWLITGSMQLGIIETLFHFLIDFIKGEGLIDFSKDQILHFVTKLTYLM